MEMKFKLFFFKELLAPRFGHRSVVYQAVLGINSILHIGGTGIGTPLHIERWDLIESPNYPEHIKLNSTLILDQYTSYPEIFYTTSNFCNSTLF